MMEFTDRRTHTFFDTIFAEQATLMRHFKPIEQLPDPPLSIQTLSAQKILKDFAWRVTEELVEASDAYWGHVSTNGLDDLRDELCDALHFLVELAIFSGVSSQQVALGVLARPKHGLKETIAEHYWEVVVVLGLAMHQLRNRPWKQTPIPTDEARYRRFLIAAFGVFIDLQSALGLSFETMLQGYARKHLINEQRIEDGV